VPKQNKTKQKKKKKKNKKKNKQTVPPPVSSTELVVVKWSFHLPCPFTSCTPEWSIIMVPITRILY
jgi:hypothetical protein